MQPPIPQLEGPGARPLESLKLVIHVSPFSLQFLRFSVAAQPFANCGHCDDQQNDDGDANSEGEAVGKQDHS